MLTTKKIIQCLCIIFLSVSIASCITKGDNPQDPYENYNRKIYKFNKSVDKVLFKPVAATYKKITPWPIRKAASNFFDNLAMIPTIANDILQAEVQHLFADTTRLLLNSTLGVLGIFDVATPLGIEKHHEDFGLTLAKWGDKESPYLVVPFFGPSTIRDSFGLTYDYFAFSIYPHIRPIYLRNILLAYRYMHGRAELLDAERLIGQAALDPYAFERDAYLQHRKFQMRQDDKKEFDPYVEEQASEDETDPYIPE